MKLPLSRTLKQWLKQRTYDSKGWTFSDWRRDLFIAEYDEWLEYYLPLSVEGLTVLDVGAGEGETARFFLEQSAKKVICIEPDGDAFRLLSQNAIGRNIVCFNKKFDVSDLKMDFDFMKMDIEGYEEAMLNVQFTKPCVIEVHGLQLRDRFKELGYTFRGTGYQDAQGIVYGYNVKPIQK